MSRAWMPMYWGDYLADTPHFTAAEHGAYLLLIAFYWCNGGLPADDEAIRRIAKCSVHQWKKIRPVLHKKFGENCEWKHKRIDAELAQAVERSESARARAMQRWQCKSQSQSQKKKKERVEARTEARATRLPKDWLPSIAGDQFAIQKIGASRVSIELQKFRNYWTAKAGRDASKLDWDATWQNWVLRAAEQKHGGVRKQSLVEIGEQLIDEAKEIERRAGVRGQDDTFGSR